VKFNILAHMTVTATLVVGSDGSTSKSGNSAGVSNSADRQTFLARRRMADCILIGGNTARREPYHRTPVPVVVLSRGLINPLADNRLAHCWNLSPVLAIAQAASQFGPTIHVEAGVSMMEELMAAGLIDTLELTITDVTGGEDKVDVNHLLSYFSQHHEKFESGTRFITALK
jgi:riboflavin biosynthesis pyrimidine reductase